MKTIRAIPLTASAFAYFGDVVEATKEKRQIQINGGHTTRYHDLANIHGEAGRVSVNIFRSEACQMPVILHQMECHPRASQMFMPLGNNPYLVIVAPAGDFVEEKLSAFLATSDQGVNYHKGTWHHYSLALTGVSDFLVVDYGDLEDNCDLVDFAEPVQVII